MPEQAAAADSEASKAETFHAVLPLDLPQEPAPRKWQSITEEAQKLSMRRTRKAALLTDAVRQFNALDRPSLIDISLFKELFYQLAGGCDASERRHLASLLARNVYLPRPIAMFFSIDEYEVAAPILLFSPVLNEVDLATLAKRLPARHLAVICRRDHLTPASIRALVRHGGEECVRLLEKNSTVQNSPALQEALKGTGPLSERETIANALEAERIAHQLGAIASRTQGQVTSKKARPETQEQPLRTTGKSVRDELVALAGKGGRLGARNNPASHDRVPSTVATPLHRRLLGAARKRDAGGLADIISGHCGLPRETVRGLIAHGGTDNVIVLFKGLGINLHHALQLLLLMGGETASQKGAYARIRKTYQAVDGNECRQFLVKLGANLGDPVARMRTPEPAPSPSLALIAERRRREIPALTGRTPDSALGPAWQVDRQEQEKSA